MTKLPNGVVQELNSLELRLEELSFRTVQTDNMALSDRPLQDAGPDA
ncbi:MAG TPA: hypothetical protein V6C63_00515 [Allocoleopsis sp.]